MDRTKLPLVISCISIFVHSSLVIYMTYLLIVIVSLISSDDDSNEDYDEDDTSGSHTFHAILGLVILQTVISLIIEIALTTVSILLYIGIKKNRPRFIGSWVYMTAIYVILSAIGLVKGASELNWRLLVKFCILILHIAAWYPIYQYLRALNRPAIQTPENYPLNAGYATAPPVVIYQASPGNVSQTQPPPPPAGMMYPPQPYRAAQLQPTVSPQLAHVNYPRQQAAAPIYPTQPLYPVATKALETDNAPPYPNQLPYPAATNTSEADPPAYTSAAPLASGETRNKI